MKDWVIAVFRSGTSCISKLEYPKPSESVFGLPEPGALTGTRHDDRCIKALCGVTVE